MGVMSRINPFRTGGPRTAPSGDHESESMELVAWRMGLIAPNGKRKERWDWFVLLLVVYTAISVPFSLSFYAFTDWDVSKVGFIGDILVDICYIVDIFVSWRTTYYNREGVLVTDKKLARKKYIRTWFAIDVVASFPYRHIVRICGLGTNYNPPQALRLPSILKLLRIMRLGKKIDRLSSSKMFRILQFTFMLIFACHWYACIWYWAGTTAPPDSGGIDPLPGEDGTSWVWRYDIENEQLGMRYTAALYWAVTTMMKSPWFHPASPGEFASAIGMIIFGCVLFAYFIGNVTAVITAANAAGGRYRGEISALKGFCTSQGLSAKLTTKLLVYQDALWTETNSGQDRQAMVRGLPSHLQLPVAVEMYRQLLDAVPFLYDCTAMGAVSFLNSLRVQVCDRGDMLLRAGSLRVTMYILQRGEIKIDQDLDMPKETIEDHVPGGRVGGSKRPLRKKASAKDSLRGRTDKMGTMLGFHDVFKKLEPLAYSVTGISRCSLLSITRSQLKELLTSYPDDKEVFEKAIDHANLSIRGGRRTSTNPKEAGSRPSEVGVGAPSMSLAIGEQGSTLATITKEAAEIEQAEKKIEMDKLTELTKSGAIMDTALDDAAKIMASSADVNDLRRKVDTLTKMVMAQHQMVEAQSQTIAAMASALGARDLDGKSDDDEAVAARASVNRNSLRMSTNKMGDSDGGGPGSPPATNVAVMMAS